VAHLLAVFSPDTHAAFSRSDRTVMGFKDRHRKAAGRVGVGDVLLCYVTGVSKWCGALRVEGGAYEDATPRFVVGEDPYCVRLPVSVVAWTSIDDGIGIRDLWDELTFTREHVKGSSRWTGALRTSLVRMDDGDARVIEARLRGA
jgi:hypothetical protein